MLTPRSVRRLAWRQRPTTQSFSVRVEGSEKLHRVVVGCDTSVRQLTQLVSRQTGVDIERLFVWDERRQARP